MTCVVESDSVEAPAVQALSPASVRVDTTLSIASALQPQPRTDTEMPANAGFLATVAAFALVVAASALLMSLVTET